MGTNNRRREAAILFFLVFLLGVLFGGVGNHLWNQRVAGQPRVVTNPTRSEIITSCTHELQLTPDQQKQLGSIIDDTRDKWIALYSPLDAQREAIRQEGRQRIREILNPAQQQKFDAFMRQLDEQRKKDAAAAAAENASQSGH
jgi:hypothetical protein